MGKKNIHLSDFINVDGLQQLQDNWSKATGIGFVTVDSEGKPVTRQSGFTDFCHAIREKEEYRELCYFCDACGGRRARKNGKPYVYTCHTGLVDFAIPIILENQYIGAILAGQINAYDKEELKPITAKTVDWMEDEELVELYEKTPKMSLEKIIAVSNVIYEGYRYFIEKEYFYKIDRELKEKKLKLMKEEKLRIEMEKSIKDIELKALHYQINPHFLFNVLNTIGRLAFFENAKMTEDVVYAFSDMMRYVLKKSSNQLGPLKDELAHVNNYLKIQKIRLGSRLQYNVQTAEQFLDVKVPFMCLQPIVENSIKYAVENKAAGGSHFTTVNVDELPFKPRLYEAREVILEIEKFFRFANKDENQWFNRGKFAQYMEHCRKILALRNKIVTEQVNRPAAAGSREFIVSRGIAAFLLPDGEQQKKLAGEVELAYSAFKRNILKLNSIFYYLTDFIKNIFAFYQMIGNSLTVT